MENYEIIWKQALPKLEDSISTINYKTFIEKLIPIDLVDSTLVLMINSETQGNMVKTKLLGKIKDVTIGLDLGIKDVRLFIGSSKEEYLTTIQENKTLPTIESHPINPKYTFDNFVVGSSNNLAFNAALVVAENPANSFNPLFVYGASGLGKTHLLHAIANEIRITKPSLNVLYSPSEKFLREFINSIHSGKNAVQESESFREKYRNVDVLMIDDIQNLSKRTGTQEEFFNIFNELYMSNKQIVLTADCDIKDIQVLSDRLRTRFEWGMKAEITPPDFETKVAILEKKASEKKVVLSRKVAEYIADISSDNVRSLEGLLTKVIFAAKLSESQITLDLAKDTLQSFEITPSGEEKDTAVKEEITTERIISCVCAYYNIQRGELIAKKRTKDIVEPRHICLYLMSELLTIPQESIGQALGRDHATVIHSRDKVIALMKESPKISHEVDELKNIILEK